MSSTVVREGAGLEVIASGKDRHVIPCEDTRIHYVSRDCRCHPVIEKVSGPNPFHVVVHSSFDGRENYEPAGPYQPKPN